MLRVLSIALLLCVLALTQTSVAQKTVPQRQPDGIVVPVHDGFLRLPCDSQHRACSLRQRLRVFRAQESGGRGAEGCVPLGS